MDGLASFGFHYNLIQDEPERKNVVGTISDKISGLKAAFKVALKSLPCIIHIACDGELVTEDKPIQHDEEQRVFSCLEQELFNAFVELEQVPQIFIILSTRKKFEPGPLSYVMIYDSLRIDHPDEKYAMELWHDNDTFSSVKDVLIGRSAKEIHYLSQSVRSIKVNKVGTTKGGEIGARNVLLDVVNQNENLDIFRSSCNTVSSNLIPNVRWDDIGGLSYVREEIINAIELPLKYPSLFTQSRRSGLLLFGPPGSGKTLVAKAVASECGLPFLSVKGPELLGSYVGESEANIRSVFENAREAAKESSSKIYGGAAILFFDEIDSLAPRRGELGDGGGVMERVVSTLLGEMDKVVPIDSNDMHQVHIFVIGATNRPDLIDPSLLRPGRFDRAIYLGLAKERIHRVQILAAQIRHFQLRDGEDHISLASKVIDFIPDSLSGADFSGIASGALMLALQRTCEDAENEANSTGLPLEEILSKWPKERLKPCVELEDFLFVANTVQPSVTDRDLSQYHAMQLQFCSPQAYVDSSTLNLSRNK